MPEPLVFVGVHFGVTSVSFLLTFVASARSLRCLDNSESIVAKQGLSNRYWAGTQMLVIFVQFRFVISRPRMFNSALAAPIRAMAFVAALVNPWPSKASFGTLSFASTSFPTVETIGVTPDCTRCILMSFDFVSGLSLSQIRWFTFAVERHSQFSGLLYRFCVLVRTSSESFSLISPLR